jgi:DNA-binding NtrC family response regulator
MAATSDIANGNGLTLKKRMERFCREAVDNGILFQEAMDQFERCFIEEALGRNNGSIIKTAAVLGLHRNTLSKKLHEWRVSQTGV